MSAAHELLVSSRKAQGLPAALEDDRACEQIAMLLNADDAGRSRRRPEPDHGRHRDLATG